MNLRVCKKMNFFCDDGTASKSHAFQLRGKYIMGCMPRERSVGRVARGRLVFGGILLFGVITFLGFQVWRLATPPHLAVQSPIDGAATQKPEIVVRGVAEPESVVEINGQQVFIGPDGAFSQQVELQSGANQIFVRATKKHGLFTTIIRTVMLNTLTDNAPSLSVAPLGLSNSLNSLN